MCWPHQRPHRHHLEDHHLVGGRNRRLQTHPFSAGVNFTNIFRAAFTLVDPKMVKKYSQVISIFLRFRDLQA